MRKILLVEDADAIILSLRISLGKLYHLSFANSFKMAQEMDIAKFDLILLDISLPDGDGFQLYKIFKQIKDIPIIFLTANDAESTIVQAFAMGCDDYLTKPFKTGELLARIEKILPKQLQVGDLKIDNIKHTVTVGSQEIPLTVREFKLLHLLARKNGIIVKREEIEALWMAEESFVLDNTINTYIKRLRQKIGAEKITTIKNLGYRFNVSNKKT